MSIDNSVSIACICMAQLGCVYCQDSEGDEVMGLSYITGEVKA